MDALSSSYSFIEPSIPSGVGDINAPKKPSSEATFIFGGFEIFPFQFRVCPSNRTPFVRSRRNSVPSHSIDFPSEDDREPVSVRDVLHDSANDLAGFVVQNVTVPVRIVPAQLIRHAVVLAEPQSVHHQQTDLYSKNIFKSSNWLKSKFTDGLVR